MTLREVRTAFEGCIHEAGHAAWVVTNYAEVNTELGGSVPDVPREGMLLDSFVDRGGRRVEALDRPPGRLRHSQGRPVPHGHGADLGYRPQPVPDPRGHRAGLQHLSHGPTGTAKIASIQGMLRQGFNSDKYSTMASPSRPRQWRTSARTSLMASWTRRRRALSISALHLGGRGWSSSMI